MENICNKRVIEMIKHEGLLSTCKFVKNFFPSKSCSEETIMKDLDRLYKKYQQLNKSKNRVKGKENLERFLNKMYEFPESGKSKETSNKDPLKSLFHNSDCTELKANVMESVVFDLAVEVDQLKKTNMEMEEELEAVIKEKDELNESVEHIENRSDEQKKNLKRTVNREAYWREKCQRLDESLTDKIYTQDDIDKLNEQIIKLKSDDVENKATIDSLNLRINELEHQNKELSDMISPTVELYDDKSRTFSTKLHQCVYSLLNNSVPYEKICLVIEDVLELCNKTANKLPSVGTVQKWSVERALLARKQISETCSSTNTTIHTDEASKYGEKWGAFATRDESGNYLLLGLRDMATKSSSDTLDTFKSILQDIDEISDIEGCSKSILANIKNTMSDRAATETKLNQLLKNYRDEILPEVIEKYNTMCEEEKAAISRMNNFFCGLHTLVHMAEVSTKALIEVEKTHFDGNTPSHPTSYLKNGQSGTTRLLLTACKAFARRGDQKNGCHGNFLTYINPFLKDNKTAFPLQPLKGNRFNILFANAGHIFFFSKHMTEFLEKLPSTNNLLKSVLHDLKQPFFLAGCKALGIISKFITTPLWRIIENKDISISEMNERYAMLLHFLEDVCLNLDDFISGQMNLYDDIPAKKDMYYDKLIEKANIDGHVIVILSVVIPALAKLIQKQYGDHLPGGVHAHIDSNETKSVDKHNKFPERVFSYVDHVLHAKPNVTTLTMEAHITFSLNKTGDWLKGKTNADEIIKQCRREVVSEKNKFKQREELIKAKRIEKQNEEFRKKEITEQKRVEKLEKETNDMIFYGLWQTEQQMENALKKIESKKEKEEALKVQLRFRKNVFNQKCDESVYVFSKVVNSKRVPLSIDELKDNVKKLITSAYTIPPPEQPHLLVGQSISHQFLEENGEAKWYCGKVISQLL